MEEKDMVDLEQNMWTTSRNWLEWESKNLWTRYRIERPGVNLW